MARPKEKDIQYLNVCLDRPLHQEFDDFCKRVGMTKTGAVEKALRMYMDTINRAMDSVYDKDIRQEAIADIKK